MSDFIALKVIFKGTHALAGHIPDNLDESPVLVQYAEGGVQTSETFEKAFRYLREVMKVRFNNDPDICGKKLVVTTDGHGSRYGVEVLETCEALDIRPNIRSGGSSWLTQMWDQIFDLFSREYVKFGMAMVSSHRATRANKHDVFTMSKQLVLAIICQMHYRGNCTWATPGDIVKAFDLVGIRWYGIEVAQLLSNPAVNGAVKPDTKFKGKELPTPVELLPPPADLTPPKNLREGTLAHKDFRIRCLEAELAYYKRTPETCMRMAERGIELESHEWAEIAAILSATKDDSSSTKRLTINSATGDILKENRGLITEKRKRKAEALEKDAKTKKAKEEAYELKLCYLRCAREGAPCTCGRTPCVVKRTFLLQRLRRGRADLCSEVPMR